MNIISQKRSPRRRSSFFKAELQSEHNTQAVFIRDISVNGALLDVTEPLESFNIVCLNCGNTKVNGIVAWYDEGRLGMEFSEPLSGKTLIDFLQGPMKVSAPMKYKTNIIAPQNNSSSSAKL